MKDGYIKVAAATPKVKVADTVYNGQLIKALMKECTDNGAKVVVFPELCITGYTCQDLFLVGCIHRKVQAFNQCAYIHSISYGSILRAGAYRRISQGRYGGSERTD